MHVGNLPLSSTKQEIKDTLRRRMGTSVPVDFFWKRHRENAGPSTEHRGFVHLAFPWASIAGTAMFYLQSVTFAGEGVIISRPRSLAQVCGLVLLVCAPDVDGGSRILPVLDEPIDDRRL